MFCNKALLNSRIWNNASIRDLSPQELQCQNFEKYLSFSAPKALTVLDRTPMAQLIAHGVVTREVVSSTPAGPTLRVLK